MVRKGSGNIMLFYLHVMKICKDDWLKTIECFQDSGFESRLDALIEPRGKASRLPKKSRHIIPLSLAHQFSIDCKGLSTNRL